MPGRQPIKLIIDTDPGIDDSLAILAAFNSPEVEVIGLTTIFGNVTTAKATSNAFVLLKLAGQEQVPVAEGSATTLAGLAKTRIADFVHGSDGFGNTNQAAVEGLKSELDAAQFIADKCREMPGQVHVLALAPLTNLALAFQLDPQLASNMGQLVILGGAFTVNGNVNPAAEANIFGDPVAADYVFGQPVPTRLVALDTSQQCRLTQQQLEGMRGKGRYGSFLADITGFYLQYHRESVGIDSVFLHDPSTFLAVIMPELFTWQGGAIRVITDGPATGHTIRDSGFKQHWNSPHAWDGRPAVQLAVAVQSERVQDILLQRFTA